MVTSGDGDQKREGRPRFGTRTLGAPCPGSLPTRPQRTIVLLMYLYLGSYSTPCPASWPTRLQKIHDSWPTTAVGREDVIGVFVRRRTQSQGVRQDREREVRPRSGTLGLQELLILNLGLHDPKKSMIHDVLLPSAGRTSSAYLFAVARKVKESDTIENVKSGQDPSQGLQELLVLDLGLQDPKKIHDSWRITADGKENIIGVFVCHRTQSAMFPINVIDYTETDMRRLFTKSVIGRWEYWRFV
jgi:hypothetical protein